MQVQREESESGKGSPRVFVMGKHIESMCHAWRAPGAWMRSVNAIDYVKCARTIRNTNSVPGLSVHHT